MLLCFKLEHRASYDELNHFLPRPRRPLAVFDAPPHADDGPSGWCWWAGNAPIAILCLPSRRRGPWDMAAAATAGGLLDMEPRHCAAGLGLWRNLVFVVGPARVVFMSINTSPLGRTATLPAEQTVQSQPALSKKKKKQARAGAQCQTKHAGYI